MSSYNRLKVSELRNLCDDRGIQRAGMNKARLIDALHYDDGENGDGSESVAASDVEGSDAEVCTAMTAATVAASTRGWRRLRMVASLRRLRFLD